MFVYRQEDLFPDPVFPVNLEELGYFVNDKDQIRKITNPHQPFKFNINRNYRWNEMQREAMNTCIREIVHSRLRDLGLVTLRLPLMAGPKKPHVPIMVSKNLSSASRIIVIFGEPVQDLGIWAYRTIGSDQGINAGSAVALVKTVLQDGDGDTALVLANTGQLVWHCGGHKAMTLPTWLALPRPSAADPPMMMSKRNKIPRNENWQEHVESIFNEVLAARGRLVREDAKIDIIGLVDGGHGVIRYLAKNWEAWRSHISAICLSHPLHFYEADLLEGDDKDAVPLPDSFAAFVSLRCRAYMLSEEPLGVPVSGREVHGCNCYSSGEGVHMECIMPSAWSNMLDWLNVVHADGTYREVQMMEI